MHLELKNCNNIDKATIEVSENTLNIKYAINGTGKTTISKAIQSFCAKEADYSSLDSLRPFKYCDDKNEEHNPSITGIPKDTNVSIFNEEYVNQYIFQPDELIKNSFDIFIRTPKYNEHMQRIDALVSDIKILFSENPDLDELLSNMDEFISDFGKAKGGYSKAGILNKGLGEGNKIENIPSDLINYSDFLKSDSNTKWIKWQTDGNQYMEKSDKCPYCTHEIGTKKKQILRVSEEYDAKTIDHLNRLIQLFENLNKCFSDNTKAKVNEITRNAKGFTDEQKSYLLEIKNQAQLLKDKLNKIKYISFNSLKDAEKVIEEINNYKINLKFIEHLNSEYTNGKVDNINRVLDGILSKAGELQGNVNKQKLEIARTIKKYSNEINNFLKYAGYKYNVKIVEDPNNVYRLKLAYAETDGIIESVPSHLSYGERNAFALVLFMYNCIRKNSEFIILDDPISSFDKNKKFAIINMLFLEANSFRGKTVLLLTHDFEPVIDVVYTLSRKFSPKPLCHFLDNKKGDLQEIPIQRTDILSFIDITKTNIESASGNTCKLIYLRRLLELEQKKNLAWQLLSNLFHNGREKPLYQNGDEAIREMTEAERDVASEEIKKSLKDFDYDYEYNFMHDRSKMIELFNSSMCNYEKLQLYRIINDDNSENKVIKKFINETFHIENDYLFQLNPLKYNTVPNFIIEECIKDLAQVTLE